MGGFSLEEIDRVGQISSQAFVKDYRNPGRPVVLPNLAKGWKAFDKWSPQFFQSEHGHRQVKVYNSSFARPGKTYMSNLKTIPFRDYIEAMSASSVDLRMFLYNMISKAPELFDDISLPTICRGFSKKFVFMFFGCEGSITPIHYDIDMAHVFHTIIYGKKRIVLFSPEQSHNLYRHPFTIRSYVDVDNPDYQKFPRLAQARGYQVILNPGETLFIPGGFWHYVVYQKASCSLSFRCRHQSLAKILEGHFNIGVVQMIDRLFNKLFGQNWFNWKEKHA